VTRSPFWCSAVLAVVLTGCGGAARHGDPFAYPRTPLRVQDDGIVLSGPTVAVHSLSFAGTSGSRVNAFLLVPKRAGRHPAVLLLHGSGGTREDLLVPAAQLASRGAVALTISQPNDAQTYRPLVVNARRALDLLLARTDVDAHEVALVGFSLGAQTAAIVAGDESRLRAVGLIAGRGNEVTRYWMRRAREDLYFQAGTHDERVPHGQLLALIRAAPGHPKVSWYDTGHGMNGHALSDQVSWLARALHLTR
jgi:dienelactone hydrolase